MGRGLWVEVCVEDFTSQKLPKTLLAFLNDTHFIIQDTRVEFPKRLLYAHYRKWCKFYNVHAYTARGFEGYVRRAALLNLTPIRFSYNKDVATVTGVCLVHIAPQQAAQPPLCNN